LSLASWTYYPLVTISELHLFIFLFAAAGLCLVITKSRYWIIIAWAFLPMLILSLISNKDLRYNLPCLGAFAILAGNALPGRRNAFLYICFAVILGFVYHLFGQGSTYLYRNSTIEIPLWAPEPPRAEDWKQNDIAWYCLLNRDHDDPLTEITVVANHPFLHSQSLNLNARLLGVKPIVFRGKTKRLGELSQFILTKTGDLGPSYSLGEIPKVVDFLEHPPQWFANSYSMAKEWPLPDGSKAILYARNIQPISLPQVNALQMEIGPMTLPGVETDGLKVTLTPESREETALGRFKAIQVNANSVKIRDLTFTDVHLNLDNPQINWHLFLSNGELRLMRLERIQGQFCIDQNQLEQLSMQKLKAIQNLNLRFENGIAADFAVRGAAVKLHESIRINRQENAASFHLDQIQVRGFSVPPLRIILSPFTDRTVSLAPSAETPFFIDLHSVLEQGNRLQIN